MRLARSDHAKSHAKPSGQRFGGVAEVNIEAHDLMQPLPRTLGQFDVVISAMAIHHLPDKRKGELFSAVFELLRPNGPSTTLTWWRRPPPSFTCAARPHSDSTGDSKTPQTSRRA